MQVPGKTSYDYDLHNEKVKTGSYAAGGHLWRVRKGPKDIDAVTVLANGTRVRFSMSLEHHIGELWIDRTCVEGIIVVTDRIADPRLRALAEAGYAAFGEALAAAGVDVAAKRAKEAAAERARQRVRATARAAALKKLP
jgi:hypothetical protein